MVNWDNVESNIFQFTVAEIVAHFVVDYIPITYMLICHHRTYKAHEKTKKEAVLTVSADSGVKHSFKAQSNPRHSAIR